MSKFGFPGAGTVTLTRHGTAGSHPKKTKCRFTIEMNPVRINSKMVFFEDLKVKIDVDASLSLNDLLSWGCSIAHHHINDVAKSYPVWTEWGLYRDELMLAPDTSDTANRHKMTGVLRTVPWDLYLLTVSYDSLGEIWNDYLTGHIDGPSIDVYRNTESEPTWRLYEGVRGGMNIERY